MTEPALTLEGPLVVRSPNWLGDAVMALTAVRNLKNLLPDEQLAVAAPEKLVALWERCPFVDAVVPLQRPKNLRATADQLMARDFVSAVLLPNSLRSAGEAWLAGIPHRYGYARNGRGVLLSHAIPAPLRNPARLHQRFYYTDLVAALGAPPDLSPPKLRKDPTVFTTGMRGLVLAFCPGAEYGAAKRWPVENFVAVARHFITARKAKILLLGAPSDIPAAEDFALRLPEAENRVGKTSLAEFMSALISTRLVVCNDSGAMHLAAALGVPTLAVFGSTEPALTGPTGVRTKALRHHVPCSPCFLRECPIDFSCMKSVTPEQAIVAAEVLLR